jgi:hypothetical protein
MVLYILTFTFLDSSVAITNIKTYPVKKVFRQQKVLKDAA